EVIDATPVIQAVAQRYVGDPAFSNLPRKFKTSISGCTRHCTNHEVNDVSFVGVRNNQGQTGFDLWVGGGLSTNPKLAVRLGVFVAPARVAQTWAGVAGIFRDYGYRVSRNRARLKFLVADWGPEKFREVLEREYLDAPLPGGPAPAPPSSRDRDHVGVQRQRDGAHTVGFTFRAGRTSGSTLTRIAQLANRYGSGQTTTTAQQQMVIRGVPESDVEELRAELEQLDVAVRPTPFRRGTMACTGIEFCKLAIVETKARADWLFTELEKRLPEFDEPITINVNGCPNSCARFQVADIGLKGQVQRGSDDEDVDGFQVHLGGHLGVETSFGRKFRGLKVTAEESADYVERVLRGYLERRQPDEHFAGYVARAQEDWLR
ncbi:MAG: nitrite/sulfite reductase, partial [Mycobacteriales bacterium]